VSARLSLPCVRSSRLSLKNCALSSFVIYAGRSYCALT
jgi:hypothetical protein